MSQVSDSKCGSGLRYLPSGRHALQAHPRPDQPACPVSVPCQSLGNLGTALPDHFLHTSNPHHDLHGTHGCSSQATLGDKHHDAQAV